MVFLAFRILSISNKISTSNCITKFFHYHTISRMAMKNDVGNNVGADDNSTFERLPSIAIPKHYKIHLKPFLDKLTFQGNETINLEIKQATDYLKLYSRDLDIQLVSLKVKNTGKIYDNVSLDYQSRWQTVMFHFGEIIQPGDAELSINFEGKLADNMLGFYASKYADADGKEFVMATTQFESTYARKAFPCWDEPVYKATFDFSFTVPSDKIVLSCTDQKLEVDLKDGWKTVEFLTTPLMSTYITAFNISDFEYIEGNTKGGVKVRVYTARGKKNQGHFALEVATKALDFYSNYFDIPYQLPKCDLIAIPDFQMGAMENWGLVTFREVILLFDPVKTSAVIKEAITLATSHEIAHMWFGNLTTMEWWTDLWLKEGYATFMEYYFTDSAYPEFDIWNQFIKDETLKSMNLDALKSSHPIEVPINDPEELEEIYDDISYAKASSIIRMLQAYLGADTFRQGLQSYLKRFQYKNACTADLWQCLSEASGQDIMTIMQNWTKCQGFPLIKVSERQNGNARLLTLEQRRFLADGSQDPSSCVWQVPITICSSKHPDLVHKRILMTNKKEEVTLENIDAGDWIKLNCGFTGYYRVQYDSEMLQNLCVAVNSKRLLPVDRFNLIGDLFALIRAGLAPTTQFLELLLNCTDEEDYNVWSELDTVVSTLFNCIERTPHFGAFQAFIRHCYSKIMAKVGWIESVNENHTRSLLRPMIIYRLGVCGDKTVMEQVHKHFHDYISGKDISANLRGKIFQLMAKFGDQECFNNLVKTMESSDMAEVKRNCLAALPQFSDISIRQKAIEYCMSDKVRKQDLPIVFFGLAATGQKGQEFGWDYFKANSKMILEKYGDPNNHLFGALVKICSRYHCTEELARDVENYFSHTLETAALVRPVAQSVENVRLNAALLSRDAENIGAWLKTKKFA